LMDVELHPDFATNGWVYIAFTDFSDESNTKGDKWRVSATKVVRGRIAPDGDGYQWKDQETIFETRKDAMITNARFHFGCKIAFDIPVDGKPRAGYVYFGMGDHGSMEHAQDLTRHNGKIHRLHDDGRIPTDNPFVALASEDPKIMTSIWSFGHRNPQGLAFNAKGELFNTEHGPRGGDEFNHVTAGSNYGWPLVAYSINYADTPFQTPWPDLDPKLADKQIKLPALRWLPSLGVCGLAGGAVLMGDDQPSGNWDATDFFAGGLSMNCVRRVRVVDGKVTEHEEVLYGLGRVRDVIWGPKKTDSAGKPQPRDLYVVLNGPDEIIRLVDARPPVPSGN
jgi:aldose sugar dehydrogenase